MKKIRNQPLHANIYSAMETWMEGIRKVQARRKEEIVSSANRSNSGGSRAQEEKGEKSVFYSCFAFILCLIFDCCSLINTLFVLNCNACL